MISSQQEAAFQPRRSADSRPSKCATSADALSPSESYWKMGERPLTCETFRNFGMGIGDLPSHHLADGA